MSLPWFQYGAFPLYLAPMAGVTDVVFRSLCKAHGLDRGSRRLLWQVARCQKLAHPACLFLEPNRFAAANLSPQLRQQAETLKRLETRLFS